MGLISPAQVTDLTTADASDVNNPVNTIANEFNGNIDNSNIKAAAGIATSKLAADNGIGANSLSASAITLGFTAITTNFSTALTSAQQVTGLTSTVTIPSGTRKIRITAYAGSINNASATINVLTVWDGTVGSGTQIGGSNIGAGNATTTNSFGYASAIVTPAAGSKTYNIGLHTNAGTVQLAASATQPAYILVEAI